MPNDALILQLLDWVAREPRGYAEMMDAWRTSCPRLTIWEDALGDNLIERVSGRTVKDARVRITALGEARLRAASRSDA